MFLAFLAQLTLRAGGDDTNRETGASCGRAATPQLERDAGTCETSVTLLGDVAGLTT